MSEFYIYVYLREDGSPYYVGKGKGNRAWSKNRRIPPPTDPSLIIIVKEFLTEKEAFDEERLLIAFYGRKDQGTGCLRNLTDGGEGTSGCIRSQDTLDKISGENNHMYGKTGEKNPNYGKKRSPETLAKMSEVMSGENHPMFGKKQSAETRAKRSASMTGKKLSPESIAKREETKKRNKEAKDLLQHQ